MDYSSTEALAWLAGIMDGEGCILFSQNAARGQRQLKVQIKNTSIFMIDKISIIYAYMKFKFHYVTEDDGYNKPAIKIVVGGLDDVETLLRAILPHLTTKFYEARTVLNYIEWRNTLPKHGRSSDFRGQVKFMQDALGAELTRLKNSRMVLDRLDLKPSTALALATNREE